MKRSGPWWRVDRSCGRCQCRACCRTERKRLSHHSTQVKYKEVMKQYNLGPNGGILTSLNLFATRFDQVNACNTRWHTATLLSFLSHETCCIS